MSRVTVDTINNVTELLMKGHCFSSPASQKTLSDVIDSICRELTESCSAGSCRLLREKISDSNTLTADSLLLLALNALVSVLSTANCRTVENVQRRVVEKSELFKALVVLFGCPNQLISYSACRAMSYFLSLARAGSEKLDYIFKFSRHGNEDFKQDNNPHTHYYQILATFDLIRILCKQLHFQKSSQPKESVCTCGLRERALVTPFKENLFGNLQQLSNFVEYFTTVFHKHFGSDQKKVTVCGVNFEREPDSGEVQEILVLDWFEMLDCGKKDVLFISYLKMTKTLLKRDKIDIVSITKVLTSFNEILNVGTKLQRTSAKLIFDVVTDFLQKPENIDMNRLQAESARNICSVFKANVFWENIPYHEGLLGFGGTEFTEKSEDQKGDLTLLRKLAKLYFVALKILFDCKTEDQTADFELVITSFSSLSNYISCKVGHDPTQISTNSESEWLCRLFADGDDDAMIFILFTVLQIYIRLTELLNQDSHLRRVLNSSKVMVMLCPHQLFWNYLKTFDFDHSLFLDLLISSETDFLQYFTSYLHCVRLEWEHCGVVFRKLEAAGRDLEERCSESDSEAAEPVSKRMRVETGCTESFDSSSKRRQRAELNGINVIQVEHSDEHMSVEVMNRPEMKGEKATLDRSSNETKDNDKGINPGLDQVLSVMIRLRMSLERLQQKKMFPYTISPLIRLLVEIEELYEK